MYDPTKVKVNYGHVRRETLMEKVHREAMQMPSPDTCKALRESTDLEFSFNQYERARRAGQVTYYELGRKSRR